MHGSNDCKLLAFSPQIDLSDGDFAAVVKAIYDRSGINLSESKRVMVVSRLNRRLLACGVETYREYLQLISEDLNEEREFINALTTNKTDFFREDGHFAALTERLIPSLNLRSRPLSVWCAASSTGEEAYTLAMVLRKYGADHHLSFRILASDIDTQCLEHAQRAVYKESDLGDIPYQYRIGNIQKGTGANAGKIRVQAGLQEFIKFRRINLLERTLPASIQFDIIFLRNVLIYFDSETMSRVVHNCLIHLQPGGYLITGHSENLNGFKHGLKSLGNSIYRKEEL